MDVDGDQFRVTAAFLYRVNGNLSSLAESLDRQESAARRLIRAASLDVGLADHHWRGPRSRKVIGSAEDYLATVREYPNAVSAGATTIRRWARAALDSADALASDDWCGTEDVGNPDRRPSGARPSGAREEIVAAWRRTCVAFGGELDAATAGVKAANRSRAMPVDEDVAEQLRAELALGNLRGPEAVRHWWNGLNERSISPWCPPTLGCSPVWKACRHVSGGWPVGRSCWKS